MSFLHSFGFKNIKVFKDEALFQFAPITLFTGANSSGKSSVSEAIRMIINHFEKISSIEKGKLPDHKFIRSIKSDSVDKRSGVLENILNFESEDNTIQLSFPISLLNYRYESKMFLDYEIVGQNVKTGVLLSLKVIDVDNNTTLYEINKDNNGVYYVQVNYLAYFKNHLSIVEDVNLLQKIKHDKTALSKETKKSLVDRLIGDFEEFQVNLTDDDVFRIEPPFEFSEYYHCDFMDMKSVLEKKKKVLDFGFFKTYDSDWIFDIYDLFSAEDDDLLVDFILQLHEDAGIDINDSNSLDFILLDKLSNYKFELGKNDEYDSLNYYVNLDKNILSPHGVLLKILENEYPKYFESFKFKRKSANSTADMFENYLYLTKNIVITDMGRFLFQLLAGDLNNGVNQLIKLNSNTYVFNNELFNSNERYYDLRRKGFSTEMLSFYAEYATRNDKKIASFIDKWIVEFQIGEKIEFELIENQCRIFIQKNNKKYNLSDEGFGFNKLLPLILSVGFICHKHLDAFGQLPTEPSVAFIEEPEAGLHPALQSKLADFFFEAYSLFNIQFIVETHSEYLIRKLQVLTASKEHPLTPDHSQIYYFYHPDQVPEGEVQYYPINIDENGVLSSNFGKGFFDESSNLNIALYLKTKVSNN